MAHAKSIRRQIEEERERLAAFEASLAPWTRRAERECKLAVAAFNVRVKSKKYPAALAWPTFRAAIIAKRHFLTLMCPGCGQGTCIDIRPEKLRYHPDASVNSLIPYFFCERCAPNPPYAVITGLSRWPPR
jgi:hypothetical protein